MIDAAVRRAGSSGWRGVLAVALVALVLRVFALALVQDTPPIGDERGYLRRAEAIAAGTPDESIGKRPPAFSWWGAAWVGVGGDPASAMRRAGLVTGLAVVLLTVALGARHAGAAAGLAAGAVIALYPDQILYDTSLWSESLYATFLLGAVLLAVADPGPTARVAATRAAAAGVLFGLAALTREVGLLALVATALWRLSRGDPARWIATASLAAAAFLVVLPWSIVQTGQAGTPVLVARTAGQNLFLGNWQLEDAEAERGPLAGPMKRARYESLGENLAVREAEAGRLAREAIRERMPAWPFEKIASEIPDLLAPRSVPAARLAASPDSAGWQGRWAYRLPGGWDAPGFRRVSAAWVVATWVLLGGAGLAGLVLAGGRLNSLWVGLVVAHVVPVIVAFGVTRFRMPLVPLLAIGAAALAVNPGAAWSGASPLRRIFALAALVLFVVVLLARWAPLESPGFG